MRNTRNQTATEWREYARRSGFDASSSRATVDHRKYPTGERVTEAKMKRLRIEPDAFQGDWNYIIRPRTPSP